MHFNVQQINCEDTHPASSINNGCRPVIIIQFCKNKSQPNMKVLVSPLKYSYIFLKQQKNQSLNLQKNITSCNISFEPFYEQLSKKTFHQFKIQNAIWTKQLFLKIMLWNIISKMPTKMTFVYLNFYWFLEKKKDIWP